MSLENIAIGLLLFMVFINLYTMIVVAKNSPEYSTKQIAYKILFLWLLPILGALFVLAFRRADRQKIDSMEESIEKTKWANSNHNCTGF
jgi:beta-lactamase regulating signal transducer with metallopeptidase domain